MKIFKSCLAMQKRQDLQTVITTGSPPLECCWVMRYNSSTVNTRKEA